MKIAIMLAVPLILSASAAFANPISFACSGAGETRWKTYFCIFGTLSNDGREITNVTFGTCEGSRRAAEEEPVDTVEIKTVKHDPRLAATSPQWRNAGAFDVSTPNHGPATFYYISGSDTARLKVVGQDLRLNCGAH